MPSQSGLKESADRYRRMVESSADIVWEVDGNGTYSYLSPSFFKVLGYKPEEAVGRTPFDFMLPAEAESVRKAFTACIGSSRPIVRLENTNVHKDGHLVVLETSGEPVLDGSGNLIGYFGIDRDVTERKKAEEELRESEIKFKAVFEGAADGIIAVDPITKKFAFANPGMCGITGYSLDELLALGVTEIHPKKDLPFVLGEFKKQAEGKKTLAKNLPVLRKDGKVVYCDVNSKPVQINGKGYLVGFFRDMTEQRRAEETLLASEVKFRSIAENMNDALYLHDFAGRIFYVNENACRMLGYKREELVGSLIKKIDTRENAALFGERIKGLIAKGAMVFDGTHRRKDGTAVLVGISVKVVSNEGGGLVQSVVRDVTERKKAEEELRDSEEHLRVTTQSAGVGLWDWPDVKSDEEWWSPVFYGLLGYKPGEIKPGLKNFAGLLHPEDKKRVFDMVDANFKKSTPFDMEYRLRTKSGEYLWVRGVSATTRDEKGKPLRMSGTIQDITERKAAEVALRESEGVFNGLLIHSPVLVYVKDDKLRIVKASDNFKGLLGKPTSELIGKSAMDLFPPEFAKTAIADDLSVLKGKRVVTSTEQLGGKTYMTIKFPIHGPGGRTYLGGFSVDITERKAAEDALKQSAQLKVQFVRNVSHELRTPLTSMRMGIGLLGERVAESGTARDKRAYELVDRNVLRLVDTVNMILDLSRAQAGITEYARQPFDLAKEIRGVAAELKPIANAKRLKFVVNAPKALRVKGDAFAVSRVLVNIVGNAIKFTDKGAVTVTAKEKGGFIEVRVRDTGCGMTKKELSGLFTEFFKASPSKIGTGLGLAITKQIVEAIGGRVWAESGGKGTTFIFTIPVGGK